MTHPPQPSSESGAGAARIPDPAQEARLDQLAAHEAWAERVAQENTGIPWADGPDATYQEMDRRDAARAAQGDGTAGDRIVGLAFGKYVVTADGRARCAEMRAEAETEAEAEPW